MEDKLVNIFSSKSKNRLKYFVLIGGCFMAVAVYATESPINLENSKINELSSSTQTNPMDMAKAKNCLTCHSVDVKIIGPAFKEVAKKYRGDKYALAKLVQKVMKGSSGTWGTVRMPANSQVNDKDAQTLVRFILALK